MIYMADICQPSAVTTEFIFFSFLQSRVIVDSLNVPKLPSMYLFESESSNKYEKMKKKLTARLFFITDAIFKMIDNPGSDRYVM
jgi:hypothetical protein